MDKEVRVFEQKKPYIPSHEIVHDRKNAGKITDLKQRLFVGR